MKYVIYLFFLAICFLSCSETDDIDARPGSDSSVAGSYANMLAIGEYLYIVSNEQLITYDISNRSEAVEFDRKQLEFGIESLFHRNGLLFIGSRTSLYIYDIRSSGNPEFVSETNYNNIAWGPCDPVVTNDTIAYVTLSSDLEGECGNVISIDELRLYDIRDLNNPVQVQSVTMIGPKGLGLSGQYLFVSEGASGLKVFDVANSNDIKLLYYFDDINTYDVIPINGLLIVIGPDALYQFDYSNIEEMALLSTLEI